MDTNNPALPDLMTVIEIVRPGGPEVLIASRRSVPRPGAGEVLIRHHAAGINGPDVWQRKGRPRALRICPAWRWRGKWLRLARASPGCGSAIGWRH